MTINQNGNELERSGSAGDVMTVAGSADTDGEVGIEIYSSHYDVAATAYLGPDERRALIERLQAIDS
jgi:hypothetical protein